MRSIPNGAATLPRAWLLPEGPAFTDEGMKLSVPWRYTLGDVPFRDEIATVGRSFGIVLWPVFELLPDISVLDLRYFSVGLQLASMLSFYVLLRQFAPGFLLSLATLSSAFMARVGFWTPGYNILGVYFLLLAISLWLHACLAGSPRRQVLLTLSARSPLPDLELMNCPYTRIVLDDIGVDDV